jgi:GNAT superfamily N-acetyltransferase
MSLHVRKLEQAELAWANERYAEVDFLPSTAADFVAVVLIDGERAALGRVTDLGNNVGELGGMYVFPEFRGRGIAKRLVDHLVAECGIDTLFCLPFEPLLRLYASSGFSLHSGGDGVPERISHKHAWCNSHYPERVLLMFRDTGAAIQPLVQADAASRRS